MDQNRRGRWILFLGLMVAYILAAAWRGSAPKPDEPALASSAGGLLADTAIALLIFAVPFGIGLLLTRPGRDDLFCESKTGWLLSVLLGGIWSIILRAAIFVPALAVALVFMYRNPKAGITEFAANRPKIENLLDPTALADPVYAIVCMTWLSFVVAGLREELWRAAVIRGVCALAPSNPDSRRMEWVGVGVSSLLFGFAHLTQGWLGVMLTGLLGIGLGMIQVLRRSLPEAVLAHGFFDASTFFFIFLLQQKELLKKFGLTPDLMKQIFPR